MFHFVAEPSFFCNKIALLFGSLVKRPLIIDTSVLFHVFLLNLSLDNKEYVEELLNVLFCSTFFSAVLSKAIFAWASSWLRYELSALILLGIIMYLIVVLVGT